MAAFILQHLLVEAINRGYSRSGLETGVPAAFEPAQRLYANFGFECSHPFVDHRPDPHSVFKTKGLAV